MKRPIINLLLFFFFLSSAILPAQDRHDAALSRLISTTEDIDHLAGSESGRWVLWRKIYDRKNDTLRIQSTAKPAHYFNRLGIKSFGFFREEEIWLINREGKGEWFSMKTGKSVVFSGVTAMEYIPAADRLLIHTGKKEGSALILLDARGRTVQRAEGIVCYTTGPSGNVFAATPTKDGQTSIISVAPGRNRELLVFPEKVLYLKTAENGKRLLVFLTGAQGSDLAAVDTESGRFTRLSHALPGPFRSVATAGLPFGSLYPLTLLREEGQAPAPDPDIWYGSDRDLKKKFFPDQQAFTVIWDAEHGKILKDITNGFEKTASLNSGRYYLNFDPTALQDYTQQQPPLLMYRYDAAKGVRSLLDTVRPDLYSDPKGKWLLSPVLREPGFNELRGAPEKEWNLYRLADGSKKLIIQSGMKTPYFADRGAILFDGIGGLRVAESETGVVRMLAPFPGCTVKLLNGNNTGQGGNLVRLAHADMEKPFLLEVTEQKSGRVMYCLWQGGITTVIVPFTEDRIRLFTGDRSLRRFTWIRENYNRAPEVHTAVPGKKPVTLYKSNLHRPEASAVRMELTEYKGTEGETLKGVLYYPADYEKGRKYPVAVHIYEKQSQNANCFLKPAAKEPLGFNIRILLEKGYFVYLPDIAYGQAGPGLSALHCIENALDELVKNPSVDAVRIALIGQSFGGYETNFIATRSDRFATYISGTAHSDIVHAYHSFNYNYMKPEFWRYETYQYRMGVPFAQDKQKYFDNNPLYGADRITAPMLLWTGLEDKNVDWQDTRTFYNALKRNDKKVIALFYKNNGHGMTDERAQTDLSRRLLDWLDYFLKGIPVEWIGVKMKKDAKD